MQQYEKIISLLKELSPYEVINEYTELLESKILTSLEIFSLVVMLEDEFNIRIPDELIIPENFKNVPSINHLIEKSSAP